MIQAVWKAYADLLRLPNMVTAAADILAGFLYAGGDFARSWPLLVLMASSACLYAGGVALNDVCDADRDAVERPNRPIPSGRIARGRARKLALLVLGMGAVLPTVVSLESLTIACALTAAIVLYDAVVKSTPVAPLTMGACRALNLVLGMSGAPALSIHAAVPPAVLIGLYVASITYFARTEAQVSSPGRLRFGTLGIVLATAGLAGLPVLDQEGYTRASIQNVVLAIGTASAWLCVGWRAARSGAPNVVQGAVKLFVLGLILFDAGVAGTTQGWFGAVAVALLLFPAGVLARLFRVT
jgi:4-hydroxybenzoate polyprenyltransferase